MTTLKGAARARIARVPLVDAYYRATVDTLKPQQGRGRTDERNLGLLLAFLLRSDSSCVDVGAHVGSVLQEIVRVAPDGRHIAFEALPHLAAALAERFPQVDVQQLALSDRSGPDVEFVHAVDLEAYSGLQERNYPSNTRLERIKVPVTTLDDVLPADYAPHLIKIDVEGGEHDVLKGAERTILNHRPVIVFEQGPKSPAAYGVTPDKMYDLVTGALGYAIFDMDGRGPYRRDSFTADVSSFARFNFIARDY